MLFEDAPGGAEGPRPGPPFSTECVTFSIRPRPSSMPPGASWLELFLLDLHAMPEGLAAAWTLRCSTKLVGFPQERVSAFWHCLRGGTPPIFRNGRLLHVATGELRLIAGILV